MFTTNALVAETERLKKFAMRLTRNKSDADDLVQSTCLRALEKMDYFEEGTNLFGWTSSIMFNIFASGYRRKKKFESQFDPELHIQNQSEKPMQDIVVELAKVKRAMAHLNHEHRQVIDMVCVMGMSYEEVSEILQIPIGTVRSRLYRAREGLKIILETPSVATFPPRSGPRGKIDDMPIPAAYITSGVERAARTSR